MLSLHDNTFHTTRQTNKWIRAISYHFNCDRCNQSKRQPLLAFEDSLFAPTLTKYGGAPNILRQNSCQSIYNTWLCFCWKWNRQIAWVQSTQFLCCWINSTSDIGACVNELLTTRRHCWYKGHKPQYKSHFLLCLCVSYLDSSERRYLLKATEYLVCIFVWYNDVDIWVQISNLSHSETIWWRAFCFGGSLVWTVCCYWLRLLIMTVVCSTTKV